eukprot:scaffold575_cov104-Cylindrotheca_fusiformis.AAC.6
MSKKRPGVIASTRLSKLSDVMVWEAVESQLLSVIYAEQIEDANVEFNALCNKFSEGKPSLSKKELLLVVQWKFAVGKKRPALLKLLNSNTEASVLECTEAAWLMSGLCRYKDVTKKTSKKLSDFSLN